MKKALAALLAGAMILSLPALADGDEGREGKSRWFGGEREGGKSKSIPAASNPKWQAECTSCHMAYLPGLLPERSWRKLMAGLSDHFGENASLDPPTQQEITDFLVKNSADRVPNRRSAKILNSIPANAAPLRVSETAYFKRKHDEIRPDEWKRPKIGSPANCIACHGGAEQGNFSERDVKIPR